MAQKGLDFRLCDSQVKRQSASPVENIVHFGPARDFYRLQALQFSGIAG